MLGNVRARHNELQRIEKELIELANMFQDLDSLVVQQEVAVQAAEANAEVTNKYTEEGNQHVGKGIQSARNRRKLKWWCLLICILIIIIAVAVGAGTFPTYGPRGTIVEQRLTINDYRCCLFERPLRQQEELSSSFVSRVVPGKLLSHCSNLSNPIIICLLSFLVGATGLRAGKTY